MVKAAIGRAAERLKDYIRDQNAAVTIAIVIFFAALLGTGGLVFDVARVFNMHSQSQAYVDNVALAAAAELDGRTGAVTRAVRAAIGDGAGGQHPDPMIESGLRLTLSDDSVVDVESLIFLEELADDPMPGARSPVDGDVVLCTWSAGSVTYESGITAALCDARAQFVLVTATEETEDFILFPMVAGLAGGATTQDATVSPQAIAGFVREMCNFPPLAICNPYESTTSPFGGDFTPTIGQQILLKAQGPNSTWFPGNFGLLQLPSGAGGSTCAGKGSSTSANYLRCVLAVMNSNMQCVSAEINTRNGEAVAIHDGFNVRFDLFDPPFQNDTGVAAYAASTNVTKGQRRQPANGCRSNQLQNVTTTQAPPKDSCFVSNTCATNAGGARFGNGVTTAQLQTYWTTNHGGTLPSGLTTRYDVYRYEIDNNMIPNKSSPPTSGENGNAICATSRISNLANDPRVLNVAIINCLENADDLRNNVPVVAFARMFLTDYIRTGGSDPEQNNLYAEVIGVSRPGNNNVLHEFPVLYR